MNFIASHLVMIKNAISLLYTGYASTVMIIAFIVHLSTTIITYKLPDHGRTIDYFIVRWVLKTAFFFSGIRIKVKGLENIPKSEPFIIASNHQSMLDILAYYIAIPHPISFFAKKELEKAPFIGRIVKYQHYAVDRKNPKQGIKELKKVGERIKKGQSAIIFPEGTRSSDGLIKPFKRGMFSLSVEHETAIVPCYISGMFQVMNKNRLRVAPGKVLIQILPPIKPVLGDDTQKKAAVSLMKMTENNLIEVENELINSSNVNSTSKNSL